jgi:hypothetical protein
MMHESDRATRNLFHSKQEQLVDCEYEDDDRHIYVMSRNMLTGYFFPCNSLSQDRNAPLMITHHREN